MARTSGGSQRTPDSVSVRSLPVATTHKGSDPTFSRWLLSQQAIVLRGATLRWRDSVRHVPELALHDIRAVIFNSGFEHRVALQAPAESTVLKGPLDFRAHFRLQPHRVVGDEILLYP